jgi:hypothetical protein
VIAGAIPPRSITTPSDALLRLYSLIRCAYDSYYALSMFVYLSSYRVLICVEHQHAVYSLDEHLKRRHSLPVAQRRELLATYERYSLCPPQQLSLPAPYSAPITALGRAHDGFLCDQGKAAIAARAEQQQLQSASYPCSYITTNRKEMRKHLNQQHSIKLSR